jgi:hypothetical protein
MGELQKYANVLSELLECRIKLIEKSNPPVSLRQKINGLVLECTKYRTKFLGLLLERYPSQEALKIGKEFFPLLLKIEHKDFHNETPRPYTKKFKIEFIRLIAKFNEADKLQKQYKITPATFFSSFPDTEKGRFELHVQLWQLKHLCDDLLAKLSFANDKYYMSAESLANLIRQYADKSIPLEKAITEPEIVRYIQTNILYEKQTIGKKARRRPRDFNDILKKLETNIEILSEQAYLAICNFPLKGRLKAEAFLKSFPYDGRYSYTEPVEYEALIYRLSRGVQDPEIIADIKNLWQRDFHNAQKAAKGQSSCFGSEDNPIFWISRDFCECLDFSSMIRATEWAEINGYREMLKFRLTEDWEDLLPLTSIDSASIFWDLFNVCRTSLAIEIIGDLIRLFMKRISQLAKQFNHAPWEVPETVKKQPVWISNIFTASHFLFVSNIVGEHDKELETKAAQFLLREQQPDGYWSFTTINREPCISTTAEAIHALCLQRPEGYMKAVKQATDWLYCIQQQDGIWQQYESNPIWLTVLILDAIDLAEGKKQLTFKLPSSYNANNKNKETTAGQNGGEELKKGNTAEEKFTKDDHLLFIQIATDIKNYPDKYREAGNRLDEFHNEEEYWDRRKLDLKISSALTNPKCPHECKPDPAYFKFHENRKRELDLLIGKKEKPLLPILIRDAWIFLETNYIIGSFLGSEDAKLALLIVWLLTDRDADTANLGLTKFENWPWGYEIGQITDEFDVVRGGLAQQWWLKPDRNWGAPKKQYPDLWRNIIHHVWAKIQSEQPAEPEPKTPTLTNEANQPLQPEIPQNLISCIEISSIIRMRSDAIARTLKASKYPVVKKAGKNYCDTNQAAVLFPKWKKHLKSQQANE